MVRLHKKLGTEEFPLINQTFYPNHKEMVSLGEIEWAGGKSIVPIAIVLPMDVSPMVYYQRVQVAYACEEGSCFAMCLFHVCIHTMNLLT